METKYHTKKSGEIKYYANYHTAWNAAIRLNQNETSGTWLFEADAIGWYLHLESNQD